ncbi:hypothetical protein HRG_000442 [Hirsutella rhossiliensis]|uniref:Uncharacterized protein n=1 Tax=Hirsutella rhossiliensis TaxID=111463 RepID=A0A9P8N6F0_9HYPO|nr:uncharacterized protein HRG_00442 [Hirsutella rhossiliensis]KAH0967800.1 hypothetical protein HRG_00442 [Hirsutella rhossiliensis]
MASQLPDYREDASKQARTAERGQHPGAMDEDEVPTASHALADESIEAEPQAQGASQVEHAAPEVRDLGWNKQPQDVPQPVVGGLANDDLWTLIRRFDKQIVHVKSIDEPPLANLDMNIADDEDFSPEKLRAQLERMYMTVGVSLVSFWKHIARLRSWRERRRTSAFLAVYAVAWLSDLLVPTVVVFLMTLILYPRARIVCFPPVPPALIDSRTGGLQKPRAGVLASQDTVTGAAEKHKGEGVEKEARNFVNSLSTLAISASAGKDPQSDPHNDKSIPDPTQLAGDMSDAKDKTAEGETSVTHDRTREPLSRSVWNKARPTMHMLADVVDTWERFGNALSPTPPFPRRRHGLVLAGCLVPVLLGSFFVTSYMLVKGLGFAVGFAFFGDPIVTPLAALANRTYPRWQKYVELRHSILRGVPTNAQLAITLLRIGERNKAPVPPPPTSDAPPAIEPDTDAIEQLDSLGVTDQEKREAIEPSAEEMLTEDEGVDESKKPPKMTRRIINLVKGTAKGGIEAALTADRAKAAAGAGRARERIGVVKQATPAEATGPVRFRARYKGNKGYAYVTATATAPALSWTSNIDDVDPAWSVAIADIDELRKVGGLGWKSKIMVGWALEKKVVDGLVVRTKQGREHHLTAVVVRNELFNRLIAMGRQMWEAR